LTQAVGFALAVGLILRLAAPTDTLTPNPVSVAFAVDLWLVSIPLILALGMWAFRYIKIRTGIALVTAGMIISGFAETGAITWKGPGVLMTTLVLCFAAQTRVTWIRVILLGSTIFSATSDARSQALITALVFASTFVTERGLAWVKRRHKSATIAILSISPLIFRAGVNGMQTGWFGSEIQRRTLVQTADGRNIIQGGRVEWAATQHLFLARPQGYGAGIQVDPGVAGDAMSAVRAAGGD